MRFLIIFFNFFILYAQSQAISQQPLFQSSGQSSVDSEQLKSYSLRTYRYNTRLDKSNKIDIYGIAGSANNGTLDAVYGGVVFTYDALIDRFPLGFVAAYTTQRYNPESIAHNAQIGLYTNFFIGAHHIQTQVIQSINIPQNATLGIATTTNFNAHYGYVFTLNSYGSHLKPFVGTNLYFLYNADKKGLALPDYNLNVNLDLGLRFVQFISQHFHFYITSIFRQDVGVINADPLMRMVVVSLDGSADFALPDEKYRSYGILKVGMQFDIAKYAYIRLGFNGKVAYKMNTLNGNILFHILF